MTYKATRPARIRQDFTSPFYGETCFICGRNKLGSNLKYPICMRCRKEYSLLEKDLRELSEHRLRITSEEVDWQEKPHPVLEGTIDEVRWIARFLIKGWFVQIQTPIGEGIELAQLIKQYLDDILTPPWQERVEKKQTKIRRYCFIVTLGATLVTAAYLLERRRDREKKEEAEAEQAEAEEEDGPWPPEA